MPSGTQPGVHVDEFLDGGPEVRRAGGVVRRWLHEREGTDGVRVLSRKAQGDRCAVARADDVRGPGADPVQHGCDEIGVRLDRPRHARRTVGAVPGTVHVPHAETGAELARQRRVLVDAERAVDADLLVHQVRSALGAAVPST